MKSITHFPQISPKRATVNWLQWIASNKRLIVYTGFSSIWLPRDVTDCMWWKFMSCILQRSLCFDNEILPIVPALIDATTHMHTHTSAREQAYCVPIFPISAFLYYIKMIISYAAVLHTVKEYLIHNQCLLCVALALFLFRLSRMECNWKSIDTTLDHTLIIGGVRLGCVSRSRMASTQWNASHRTTNYKTATTVHMNRMDYMRLFRRFFIVYFCVCECNKSIKLGAHVDGVFHRRAHNKNADTHASQKHQCQRCAKFKLYKVFRQ